MRKEFKCFNTKNQLNTKEYKNVESEGQNSYKTNIENE